MLNCGKVARVDKFAQDPALPNGPKPSDFIQLPGYATDKTIEGAKGHLFSYEDAMCNPQDNAECFYVDQMYWQYQNLMPATGKRSRYMNAAWPPKAKYT